MFFFLVVILLFKMTPKCGAEVLSSHPMHKTCLMEKIHVLEKFPQTGVTVLLAVRSVLMNQHILNKVSFKNIKSLCIDLLTKNIGITLQETVFPLEKIVQYSLIQSA